MAYANDPRVGDICAVPIARPVGQIGALPSSDSAATRTVGQRDVLEPAMSWSARRTELSGPTNTYAVPNPKRSMK